MIVLKRMSSFVVVLLTAGVFVGATATTASAQSVPKQPVIDKSPARSGFDSRITILGHLEEGIAGDEVALERRHRKAWRVISIDAADENAAVNYRLNDVRRSADYRLAYTDPATDTATYSEVRRVVVKSRLRVNLSSRHVMRGRAVTISGRLLPKEPNRSVRVRQRVRGEWRTIGTAYVRDGRFALRFEAKRVGFRRLRVAFAGDRLNARTRRGITMRVYGPARATWYGPGFYGNRTACGQRLTTETLGVAHRWLACGTKVAVLYRGRTILVPVIDRGPYAHGADWDLTQETAERLRFSGTDTIGVDPGA